MQDKQSDALFTYMLNTEKNQIISSFSWACIVTNSATLFEDVFLLNFCWLILVD